MRNAFNKFMKLPKWERVFLTCLSIPFIIYGSTKPSGGYKTPVFCDEFIINTGSYATNDTFHAKWGFSAEVSPNSTLFSAFRVRGSTNEWEDLGSAPILKMEEEWYIENATNYEYMLYTDWVPKPTVHTNGVYVFYVERPLVNPSSNKYLCVRAFINVKGRKVAPLPKGKIDEDGTFTEERKGE